MWFGAGRGARHAVFALVGSGVGAAVVTNGVDLPGRVQQRRRVGPHHAACTAAAACRCGARGCLEAYVGAEAIVDRYRQARRGRAVPGADEESQINALLAAAADVADGPPGARRDGRLPRRRRRQPDQPVQPRADRARRLGRPRARRPPAAGDPRGGRARTRCGSRSSRPPSSCASSAWTRSRSAPRRCRSPACCPRRRPRLTRRARPSRFDRCLDVDPARRETRLARSMRALSPPTRSGMTLGVGGHLGRARRRRRRQPAQAARTVPSRQRHRSARPAPPGTAMRPRSSGPTTAARLLSPSSSRCPLRSSRCRSCSRCRRAPRRRHPALAGPAGDRVVDRERRHPGRRRGRRQHRHPLVQRVQRSTVDPGRPGRHRHHQPGRAAAGRPRTRARTRSRPRPTRADLDHHLLHHHRHRRRADAQRHRHRPVRADERHRPGHRVRLLAVGVPGVSARSAPADAAAPPTPRWTARPPPRRPRTPARPRPPRSTATPAPAGRARSATRSGSRSTSARTPTDLPGRAELGGGLRHGVPDPGLGRRHHVDHDLLHHDRHRRHADARPSAGTGRYVRMNGTAARHRRTATRCGSSRVQRRRVERHPTPPARCRADRPAQPGLRPERRSSSTRRRRPATIQSRLNQHLHRSRRPTSSAPSATRSCSSPAPTPSTSTSASTPRSPASACRPDDVNLNGHVRVEADWFAGRRHNGARRTSGAARRTCRSPCRRRTRSSAGRSRRPRRTAGCTCAANQMQLWNGGDGWSSGGFIADTQGRRPGRVRLAAAVV